MRLVSYLRVSTDGQVVNGYGLDAQRDDVQRWAAVNGHEIVREFVDGGLSGTLGAADRPGLSDALQAIQDGTADGFLVARLDRLARELTIQEVVLATVWKLSAEVFTADMGHVLRDDPDDPMRTAMRQMAGVFAQLDRAMVLARLRAGKRAKRAQNGKTEGRYCYGTSKGGPVIEEQAVLTLVRALADQGLTWRQIAVRVNNKNWTTRSGSAWTAAALYKVATRAGITTVRCASTA